MQIQAREDNALARALELLAMEDAETAGRARIGLETLLEGVYRSKWPEMAWRFSHLTNDGYPVEFTFTPPGLLADETLICYACEAAGPETPDTKRLDLALEKLSRLGAGQPAEEQVRRLRAMQGSREENFSVFTSGRH